MVAEVTPKIVMRGSMALSEKLGGRDWVAEASPYNMAEKYLNDSNDY